MTGTVKEEFVVLGECKRLLDPDRESFPGEGVIELNPNATVAVGCGGMTLVERTTWTRAL